MILAPENYNEASRMISAELEKIGFAKYEITEGDISLLGGFILEIPELSLRITRTLENSINMKRDDIGQFIQNYVRDGGVN